MASIQKRGKTFYISVSCGYNESGRQIRKTATYKPPEGTSPRKAEKLAADYARDFELRCKGSAALNENMKFSELADLYRNTYLKTLKPSSAYTYSGYLKNHLLPRFGTFKLSAFSPVMLTKAFADFPEKQATRRIYVCLQSVFTFAVNQGIIKESPCRNVILPKIEKSKVSSLTIEQTKELLKLCETYSLLHTFVKLLIYTGMRSGEALGLMWKDIDFDRRIIHICRSLSVYTGRENGVHGMMLQTPKTKTSERSIAIPDTVIELLKEHRTYQDKERTAAGEAYIENDLIFARPTGEFINRSFLLTQFKREIADTSFSDCTFHQLRHCNATLLIYSGADIKTVSAHLGHSSIRTTADIYTDVLAETESRLASLIDDTLK